MFSPLCVQAAAHASTCQQGPATDWCIQIAFPTALGWLQCTQPLVPAPLVHEAEPI